VLANCGFATVFAAPKPAGLWQQERSAAERQSYGSPKNGRSEANRLAMAGYQIQAMAAKLLRAQTALREGLMPFAAAITISSQATVLAYQYKPFSGLRIMKQQNY
jgi:hypothetical protein